MLRRNLSVCLILATATHFATACHSETIQLRTNQNSTIPINQAVTSASATVNPTGESTRSILEAQRVSFESVDGAIIVGTFYAAQAPDSSAVLLLHQWGSNRESFGALARQLQTKGIAVMAIDGRGFGESIKRADGSKLTPSRTDEAVAGMKSDVQAAVQFLAHQANVKADRIGILGASYGSSLAIIHAAQNSTVKAAALLSPGINYFGNLPTEAAVKSYGARPLLIVAAEDDAESATAARSLNDLATGEKHQLQIYPKGGHGTDLLTAVVGLEKLLIEFFIANL
jgi:dienelactone hydrolase